MNSAGKTFLLSPSQELLYSTGRNLLSRHLERDCFLYPSLRCRILLNLSRQLHNVWETGSIWSFPAGFFFFSRGSPHAYIGSRGYFVKPLKLRPTFNPFTDSSTWAFDLTMRHKPDPTLISEGGQGIKITKELHSTRKILIFFKWNKVLPIHTHKHIYIYIILFNPVWFILMFLTGWKWIYYPNGTDCYFGGEIYIYI